MNEIDRARNFIKKRNITDQDLIQDIYVIALSYNNTQAFHSNAMKRYSDYLSENNETPVGIINVQLTYRRTELTAHQQALIADTIRDCCFNKRPLDTINCERDIAIFLTKCNDADITYSEIAKKFNLSLERVRQICNTNFRRLRHPVAKDRFGWNEFMASEVEGFID